MCHTSTTTSINISNNASFDSCRITVALNTTYNLDSNVSVSVSIGVSLTRSAGRTVPSITTVSNDGGRTAGYRWTCNNASREKDLKSDNQNKLTNAITVSSRATTEPIKTSLPRSCNARMDG